MDRFFRVIIVLLIMFLPLFSFSSSRVSFHSPQDSAIKIALKHSGKRVVECDEKGLFKDIAQRYRQDAMGKKGVKMELSYLAECPAERYPIEMELFINNKKILEKDYPPTGLRRDMASYAHEVFVLTSGTYDIMVRMNDSGHEKPHFYTFSDVVEFKAGEIKRIDFDPVGNNLILK